MLKIMTPDKSTYLSIEEYISSFPESTQTRHNEMRKVIYELMPDASEKISYGMPTFIWNKKRIYFAAFAKHIGFYPGPAVIEIFKDELTTLKVSKGTIQFPLNKPLPLDLFRKMVAFKIKENL